MPLPALLLERLKKRGIIKDKEVEKEEEVFIESYEAKQEDEDEEEQDDKLRDGAPGCPNKWNQYHLCSQYCFDQWQEGVPENRLGDTYHHARKTCLLKYPLPDGWKEVYDNGIKRHYYWNPSTDQVSWLPPKHPLAIVGPSAIALAKEFFEPKKTISDDYDKESRGKRRREDRRKDDTDRNAGRTRDEPLTRERRLDESNLALSSQMQEQAAEMELSDRERLRIAKKRGADPMDPSSYSDTPEGRWNSGLVSEAKTGVDVTATGTLFQSRPYPAPGSVLRRKNPDKKD